LRRATVGLASPAAVTSPLLQADPERTAERLLNGSCQVQTVDLPRKADTPGRRSATVTPREVVWKGRTQIVTSRLAPSLHAGDRTQKGADANRRRPP